VPEISKEYRMTDKDFQSFVQLAYDHTGIVLSDQKREMVYSRIARRLRVLGLNNFTDYHDLLAHDNTGEIDHFINAITTNLTSFFREKHHFEFLKDKAFPEFKMRKRKDNKLRIWSAACSTGEEPYSLAILLSEEFPKVGWDIKILATDLDSNVLAHGRKGLYEHDRIKDLDKNRVKQWFSPTGSEHVQVNPILKQLIRFNRLNLLGSWPMKNKFDIVFCRNVLIYFNRETQVTLFERYSSILNPNGYLMIGHSESIPKSCTRFKPIGKTIYQNIG
jgi:chemotaxis protein methyltransferase CheR